MKRQGPATSTRVNKRLCSREEITPLMIASNQANIIDIKLLLAQSSWTVAQLNQPNQYGNTLAMLAAMYNDTDLLHTLYYKGADLEPAFEVAYNLGALKSLKKLIKLGVGNIEWLKKPNQQGDTLAVGAVLAGDSKFLAFLDANGVDINVTDSQEVSTLSMASDRGYPEIIKKLLEAGNYNREQLNAVNAYGNTLMMLAAMYDRADIVRILRAKGADDFHIRRLDGHTALTLAASHLLVGVVKQLLALGGEIPDRDKHILISASILRDDPDLFEMLYNRGIDLTTEILGLSLFQLALNKPSLKIIKKLLALGMGEAPQFNQPNLCGETLVMAATRSDDAELIEMLYARGADLNTMRSDGATALSIASDLGIAKAACKLLELGAGKGEELNAFNSHGNTLIMLGAFLDDPALIEAAYRRGADLRLKKSDGSTAFVIASQENKLHAVKKLIELGAETPAEMIMESAPLVLETMEADDADLFMVLHRRGGLNLRDGLMKYHKGWYPSSNNIKKILTTLLEHSIYLEMFDLENVPMLLSGRKRAEQLDLICRLQAQGIELDYDKLRMKAVRIGETDLLKCLCDVDEDMGITDSKKYSLLVTAIMHQQLDAVRALLEMGVNLDYREPDTNNTILHIAAKQIGRRQVSQASIEIINAIAYHANNVQYNFCLSRIPLKIENCMPNTIYIYKNSKNQWVYGLLTNKRIQNQLLLLSRSQSQELDSCVKIPKGIKEDIYKLLLKNGHLSEIPNRFITGEMAAIKNKTKLTPLAILKKRALPLLAQNQTKQVMNDAMYYLAHSLMTQDKGQWRKMKYGTEYGEKIVGYSEENAEVAKDFKKGLNIVFHPYMPEDIKKIIWNYARYQEPGTYVPAYSYKSDRQARGLADVMAKGRFNVEECADKAFLTQYFRSSLRK